MRITMRAVALMYLLLQTGYSLKNSGSNVVTSKKFIYISCFAGREAFINIFNFETDAFTRFKPFSVLHTKRIPNNFNLNDPSLSNYLTSKRHHIKEFTSSRHNKTQHRFYRIINDIQEEDNGVYISVFRLNVYSPDDKTKLIQKINNIRILHLIVKPWNNSSERHNNCVYSI